MRSVAVVMPCYEEEGLAEFLLEIEEHLAPVVDRLEFVVVDDASPSTPAAQVLAKAPRALRSPVHVYRNLENLGHGPSALNAYRGGLATGCDLVLHVDGDGQFNGADMAHLLEVLGEAPGVVGVRMRRTDPWFRGILTRGARLLVRLSAGPVRDANTPLRLYRAETVVELLAHVDPRASVPHLQFSMIEARSKLPIGQVEVAHRVRRGDSELGTTWQRPGGQPMLPSRRLLRFARNAALELVRCRRVGVVAVPMHTSVVEAAEVGLGLPA